MRFSLQADIEQRQYENLSDVLERKFAASDDANAAGDVCREVRAPPDVYIDFRTYLSVSAWKSGRRS